MRRLLIATVLGLAIAVVNAAPTAHAAGFGVVAQDVLAAIES